MQQSGLHSKEVTTAQVTAVRFGFFSDDEVRKMSAKRVESPLVMDNDDLPVKDGLYDPAMGPLDGREICPTCGLGASCPGHMGHIELAVPVYNPLVFGTLYRLLRSCCLHCFKLRMQAKAVEKIALRLERLSRGEDPDTDEVEEESGAEAGAGVAAEGAKGSVAKPKRSSSSPSSPSDGDSSEGSTGSGSSLDAPGTPPRAPASPLSRPSSRVARGSARARVPTAQALEAMQETISELFRKQPAGRCANCGAFSPTVKREGLSKLFLAPLPPKRAAANAARNVEVLPTLTRLRRPGDEVSAADAYAVADGLLGDAARGAPGGASPPPPSSLSPSAASLPASLVLTATSVPGYAARLRAAARAAELDEPSALAVQASLEALEAARAVPPPAAAAIRAELDAALASIRGGFEVDASRKGAKAAARIAAGLARNDDEEEEEEEEEKDKGGEGKAGASRQSAGEAMDVDASGAAWSSAPKPPSSASVPPSAPSSRAASAARTLPQYLTPAEAWEIMRSVWAANERVLNLVYPTEAATRAWRRAKARAAASGRGDASSAFPRPSPLEAARASRAARRRGFEELFLRTIAVAPNRFRAPSRMGDRVYEHPQNTLLVRAINDTLELVRLRDLDPTREPATDARVLARWLSLQNTVNAFIDSSASDGRVDTPGIRQTLEKKEGLFRKNMMGKRVNFAARSVISPDPGLNGCEIGIPPYIAARLCFPERVTRFNLEKLREAVLAGPGGNPGAAAVEDRRGRVVSLDKLDRAGRERVARLLGVGLDHEEGRAHAETAEEAERRGAPQRAAAAADGAPKGHVRFGGDDEADGKVLGPGDAIDAIDAIDANAAASAAATAAAAASAAATGALLSSSVFPASSLSARPPPHVRSPEDPATSRFGGSMVVYRALEDGDVMLTNRQPTLHKPGVLAHRARIMRGERTIRMHYANCSTFNADFDGDEINVHLPQDQLGRAEGYGIVSADRQFFAPTDGKPLRGLIQDHVVGATLLTMRDRFLEPSLAAALVHEAVGVDCPGGWDVPSPEPAVYKPRVLCTGKQVLSAVLVHYTRDQLPFSCETGAKVPAGEWGASSGEGRLVVRQSHLVAGVVDKAAFGGKGLLHLFHELYGARRTSLLTAALSRLFSAFLQRHGFTCGLADVLLDQPAEERRTDALVTADGRAKGAAQEIVQVDLEHLLGKQKRQDDEERDEDDAKTPSGEKAGKTKNGTTTKTKKNKGSPQDPVASEPSASSSSSSVAPALVRSALRARLRADPSLEALLDMKSSGSLHPLSSEVVKACLPRGQVRPFRHNMMALMTVTGAKGSVVNFSQISCLLGQQELEGRRVPRMASGKTLPCFAPYDVGARSGGFVGDRFLSGLRPQEYYFHCMAGREGLVDTTVKTSRSGYLQRCLIKNLEALKVGYDGTVRDDADGSVVQFAYGEDGIDPTYVGCLRAMPFFYHNMPQLHRHLTDFMGQGGKKKKKEGGGGEGDAEESVDVGTAAANGHDAIVKTEGPVKMEHDDASEAKEKANAHRSGFPASSASLAVPLAPSSALLSATAAARARFLELARAAAEGKLGEALFAGPGALRPLEGAPAARGAASEGYLAALAAGLAGGALRAPAGGAKGADRELETLAREIDETHRALKKLGLEGQETEAKAKKKKKKNKDKDKDATAKRGEQNASSDASLVPSSSSLTAAFPRISLAPPTPLDPAAFADLMTERFQRSMVPPGEAVGVIAAQSIGEPSTQMTLNTFHMAGRGEANVTLGIPRLREILMTAARELKTPVMTLPALAADLVRRESPAALPARGHASPAQALAARLRRVRLAEALAGIRVQHVTLVQGVAAVEAAGSKAKAKAKARAGEEGAEVSSSSLSRLYEVTLRFHPEEAYPAELGLTFGELARVTRVGFVPKLQAAVKAEIRRASTGSAVASVALAGLGGEEGAGLGTHGGGGGGGGANGGRALGPGAASLDGVDLVDASSGRPSGRTVPPSASPDDDDDAAASDADDDEAEVNAENLDAKMERGGGAAEMATYESEDDEDRTLQDAAIRETGEEEEEDMQGIEDDGREVEGAFRGALDGREVEGAFRGALDGDEGTAAAKNADERASAAAPAGAAKAGALSSPAASRAASAKRASSSSPSASSTSSAGVRVDRRARSVSVSLLVPYDAPALLMREVAERVAADVVVRGVKGIGKCYVLDGSGPGRDGTDAVQTDGMNVPGAWRHADLCDVDRLGLNSPADFLRYYGVEAARASIMGEVGSVFGAYGIGVDPRHLSLIADAMTRGGGYAPLNRLGIQSSPAPFLKISFETAAAFLVAATLHGAVDSLQAPASRIVVGRPVGLGTGAVQVLQQEA